MASSRRDNSTFRCAKLAWNRSGGLAMKTLEQRLQRLEDVEAIKVLKAEYCAYCDDHYDPDGIASLFVEHGVWDGGFMGRFEGTEAIRDHFAGVSSIMGFA
ncbi:MAG TPA: hypothetical protein EYO78_01125, partial [Gammaproteobacteria bacterium]|nr:hypothetical protein [Gammaproteobacteria bacterium]